MKLDKDDLAAQDQRFRTAFVNSLSGFKSANLVGTANASGQSNLSIVSSVVHVGANPALVGMVMRPHTVPRGTLENIISTGVYTLNHVHTDIFEQAHQCSARYANDVSEFVQVALTEQWQAGFAAPFVRESLIKLGVEFREKHAIDVNRTSFVVGEIVSVELPDEIVSEDGFVSLESAGTVAVSSLDTYHQTRLLAHLSYAKPDKKATKFSRTAVSSKSLLHLREAKSVSIPQCALVVAASGGIGHAFCQRLLQINPDILLIRTARDLNKLPPMQTNVVDIALDLSSDESIAGAVEMMQPERSIDWVFVASGWLHDQTTMPEKTFRSLAREHLHYAFDVNAVGPALFLQQLLKRMDKSRSMRVGILSARVGSVSDNRLGGWHAYRSSKAALHMLIKNFAIECNNTRRAITLVGLQPGTTDTALSKPFQKSLNAEQLNSPEYVADQLIKVMSVLEPEDSGQLFDLKGLPFEP